MTRVGEEEMRGDRVGGLTGTGEIWLSGDGGGRRRNVLKWAGHTSRFKPLGSSRKDRLAVTWQNLHLGEDG